MNVKLIKMWSGEDVVADVVSEDVAKVIIKNPIVALPTSQGTLGFAPWSPLLVEKDTPLEVVRGYVVGRRCINETPRTLALPTSQYCW